MIELQGVCKRYPRARRRQVLGDVDLLLGSGVGAIVRGGNGAGKTTLAKLLSARAFADAGVVRLFDRDVARLRRTSVELLRRRIGLVTQELQLLQGRTAGDNVAMALRTLSESRCESASRASEALFELGMDDAVDEPVDRLSRGEQQLVMISRALVRDSRLLVLDEPSAHLDDGAVAKLAAAVTDRVDRGATAVLLTADSRLAEALGAFRKYSLCAGRLASDDWMRIIDSEDAPFAVGEIGAVEYIDEEITDRNVVPFPLRLAAGGGE